MIRRAPFAPSGGAVAAIAIALGLAACAENTAVKAPEAQHHLSGPYDQEKDDISQLWMQIRQWRVEMGMLPEPDSDAIPAARHVPISRLRLCPEDPQPETQPCRDTCSLANAICETAQDICRIADKLQDDAWAREKCDKSRASCKEATERCCACAAEETGAASESD